ncbi:response regulator [Curtobacterium herbarum]|uniref:Response regulator transcription factor n=1 Tax=Curtobacterium herbarum TaxID=150122 RepID=A0ABP4K4V7_9MICO|nr:response regulator transcription factor [Curtobacterium herbarum]MBM7475387.1 DNA-binding NarL/FixJ family response regulator [Curtobacterium herbarum]MCS6543303.1 response regulator transcription factor [Curtobacterium herbarum]
MIRVALVDDQELFRSGLRVVLDAQEDMVVVGEAANGADGLVLIHAEDPDVVLLDMRMPVMDGLATMRALAADRRADDVRPRVIVLTTFALDRAAMDAIRSGAQGFLLKDTTPAFLTAAIRTVHDGNAVLAPGELSRLLDRHEPGGTPTVEPPAEFGRLSPREVVVFARVARGETNAEIAAAEYVSESTVKTQVSSILQKLDLRDRVHLVVWAHDHGLPGDTVPSAPNGGR